MTWLPEWRVTVGDDVYTTVTSVSYATGRLDIDRQCTAGYCRVEIINTDNTPFTINVTEPITLELKNTAGTYVTVFGGEVSDFNIGVRAPEEAGYVTTGTILGIGALAKLTKAIYNTALAEALDGAQIAAILGSALNLTWAEVTPIVTWDTYPADVTWAEAESYVGTIDSGFYTMISQAASATAKSQTLVDQIATSALGQIYESITMMQIIARPTLQLMVLPIWTLLMPRLDLFNLRPRLLVSATALSINTAQDTHRPTAHLTRTP
jgi:hypothetical protein